MKKKSTLLFGFFSLVFSANLLAQDPHFSQFYANRIYLNPAYAGFDPGKTVILNFRNQWPGIPDGDAGASRTSYRTMNVTGDFRLPCFEGIQHFSLGLAGSLFRDDAGKAPLVTQGGGLAFSAARRLKFSGYHRRLDYLDLRIGTQLSMLQRHIDGDWFIYSNQLDPMYGLISDPSILNLRSKWYPNLNAGVMLNMGNKGFTFSSGISISNILQPNQALRDAPASDLLPRRYTGHMGATMGNNVFFSPQIRADFQSGFDLGLFSAGFYLQNDKMYTGFFFQGNKKSSPQAPIANSNTKNVNHFIINLGIDIESVIHFIGQNESLEHRFVLGASYDLSFKRGIRQQTTHGALELSLRMFFDGGRKYNCLEEKRYNYKRCPITH